MTFPQNEQVLVERLDMQVRNEPFSVSIARYNVASGVQLPTIALHTTGVPSIPFPPAGEDFPFFATADDSIFITPFGDMSEIDHLDGTYVTVNYVYRSMSTDLTTLNALDAASTSDQQIVDTFRAPFTTVFQRGIAHTIGGFLGRLNRTGSLSTGFGWDPVADPFVTKIESVTIPGVDKAHIVDFGAAQGVFTGGDALDGNRNLYYFIIVSPSSSIPDRIVIENLNDFTYAGYINLPKNHGFTLAVSQVNGDLFLPVGSSIYVWNIPSCGCAVQRKIRGHFHWATPVPDRSGESLILVGHPSSNLNETDVIGVDPQTGTLVRTYTRVGPQVGPAGQEAVISHVLVQ